MIRYIMVSLALGIIVGYLNNNISLVEVWVSDVWLNASLLLLLFVMGLAFGMDKNAIAKMRQAGFKILIVPFAVACGSILGGIVAGLVLNINVFVTSAASAGYGWYTLAGPLMGQLFGTEWAALGFATNFLRELLTIVTISFMIKIDRYAAIAAGGATTMDTTLPLIVRYCGSDALITAFSSGLVLSIMAPFTIIALASMR